MELLIIFYMFNYVLISATSANLIFNNCAETLVKINETPLITTNCCLTKLCSNTSEFKQMIRNHATIKGISIQLCTEKFYLYRELLVGCASKDKLNREINKDGYRGIEQTEMVKKKRHTAEMNPAIVDDSGWESTKILTSESSKSNSNIQTTISQPEDKEIHFDDIRETPSTVRNSLGLQFLDIPVGDEMHIDELQFNNEYLLFDIFSVLMGLLHLDKSPLELLKGVLDNRVPLHLIILQLIKTEYILIGWISLWTILTISIPCILFANLCCPRSGLKRLDEDSSDTSSHYRWKSTERAFGWLLHLLLLLLLVPIVLMLIGNEQISKQISKSSIITNTIFNDINTFISNTHLQLTFAVTSSTDIAIETIRKDLENVENLLGRPYRDELASETGINIAFENLNDLKYATNQVTVLVSNLLDECAQARAAGNSLQEQLREIAGELTVARQQCLPKDRPLCYTLQHAGLDINFSCDNLTIDTKLTQLERLGGENHFDLNIENAHGIIETLPVHVSGETMRYVQEIKTVLNRKRTEVYKSAHSLDELVRSLSDNVMATHGSVTEIVRTAVRWDLWRWSIVLGTSIALILIWCLLLCGTPCGCGSITYRSVLFLTFGIVLSALVCLVVWCLGVGALLVGGYGDAVVCRPLYDQPHYNVLGELLNTDGVLYSDRSGGVFKDFVKANDTITIQDVLKGCQRNYPAFSTFHLNNFFNIDTLTNHKSWRDFNDIIGNFTIDNNTTVEILNPSLQLNLQFLSTLSSINLTKYRYEMSRPVTKHDLNSFADQLNNVARQMNDLTTSSRLNDLSLHVRRVIRDEFKRFNDLKERILYKITALDVLMTPLSKRADQSLAHLKTIQYYLDNQASVIAERNSRQFISRIENYLVELHQHIQKITKDVGHCKPLWDIYEAVRFCLCKLIIGPTNGISFCCFFTILIFMNINVVAVKLVQRYRDNNDDLLTSISHRRARDGLLIDDEGIWAAPPRSTPPDLELHNVGNGDEQTLWSSPRMRQPSESLRPPPPMPGASRTQRLTSPKSSSSSSQSKMRTSKRLSTIASKITATRVPQVPSVSRIKSPRRKQESLRLIDPIRWKSGSLSPRSWI